MSSPIDYYLASRYPRTTALAVLTIVSVIFVYFPACIFSGASICWDYDVTNIGHRNVLLIVSVIILPLCAWAWFKVIKDPKFQTSAGKPVAALIVVLTIIVALFIIAMLTSSYWGPVFGHPNVWTTTTVYH